MVSPYVNSRLYRYDFNKTEKMKFCTHTICTNTCKHKKGWYMYADFCLLGIFLFKRKYYVCSDCGESIPQEKWKLI
jgi:hypothetical protein